MDLCFALYQSSWVIYVVNRISKLNLKWECLIKIRFISSVIVFMFLSRRFLIRYAIKIGFQTLLLWLWNNLFWKLIWKCLGRCIKQIIQRSFWTFAVIINNKWTQWTYVWSYNKLMDKIYGRPYLEYGMGLFTNFLFICWKWIYNWVILILYTRVELLQIV